MTYQDQGDDEDEVREEFVNLIFRGAEAKGAMIVEHSLCPVCKNPNFHCHRWAETLQCMAENCKARYPSKVARPTAPGEPTADDFRNALEALHDAQVLQLRKGLTKPDQAEIDALPEGIRLLLVRERLASVQEAIVKVFTVAEQLATL